MAKDTITIKNLYERIITLEAKVDLMADDNLGGRNYFRRAVYLIIGLEIVGIVVDLFL